MRPNKKATATRLTCNGITRTAIPFALCLVLAGCAVQRAQEASRAQSELIGMSKVDLLSCAGVPARQAQAGDIEFLTYEGGGDSSAASVATAVSTSVAVVAGKRLHRYCEATFALKNGTVQRVTYQGRTGGLLTPGEQCAFIVEGCLK